MTFRITLIVAMVAAFAWAFSRLATQPDRMPPPESQRVACQDTGGACSRPVVR
jgi:hypothetical protein